jgi:hypothetical protein
MVAPIAAIRPKLRGFNNLPSWLLRAGTTPATLDIDFVNDQAYNAGTTAVASLLSCSRASTGYYTKADGTLQSFSSNTLRYGTNGLLVEEARTNLKVRSQEFDSGSWNTGGGRSVTADTVVAPDGTTTADLVTATATGTAGYLSQGTSVATTTAYVDSVFGKQGTKKWLNLTVYDGTNGNRYWFDLNAGVVGSTALVGTGLTSVTAEIVAHVNGWYRCIVKFTTKAVSSVTNFYAFCDGDASLTLTNGGTGSLWGAQLEAGTSVSSYIPTAAVSASRAADVVTFSDLTWFDGTSSSIYAEWVAKNTNNAKVWALDATNAVLLDEQTGMSARIADAGATFAITTATTATAGATVKAAARMAANDIALSLNGGTVGTDTTATQPGTLTASRLGIDLSSANALNSYIRRISAFKSLLVSNANLQSLTS